MDAERLLACEVEAWRRAVLAARERVVFVVPKRVAGRLVSPHSFWHEIAARLDLKETATAKVTRSVQALLHEPGHSQASNCSSALPCRPLASEWSLPRSLLSFEEGRDKPTSATALETFATCPLAWVLDDAGIERGMVVKVPEGPLLNGTISHRLVEEVFLERAFEQDEEAFVLQTKLVLDALIRTEAATLLLPGASSERTQLEAQHLRRRACAAQVPGHEWSTHRRGRGGAASRERARQGLRAARSPRS